MGTQGQFGYIIGKKKRLMNVQNDANLLWQIGVRELYILMKNYESIENLKKEFENIKKITTDSSSKPKSSDIEKCKLYTDLEVSNQNTKDWYCLLKYCQSSFINILDIGYILNSKEKPGYILILDFNKNILNFYFNQIDNKKKLLNQATIDEIMNFDNMPNSNLILIKEEMKLRVNNWLEKYNEKKLSIEKLSTMIKNAKQIGDINIEIKLEKIKENETSELNELIRNRREFYYRLKAIDLIEE